DAARQDAEEAGLLVPSNGDPAIAAAAAHLVAGSGPGARRWLAGLEGEDVDGPALWGLVLAWWLEGDEERARDHLALARREAQNLEVRLVDAGKEPSRAGEAFSGIVLAWARRRGARTWL